MQFPCARCGRTYEIADELCVGRAVKVACPACGGIAVHRVPVPSAPAPVEPPPPAQAPSFFDSDDDDFESAWSALEAPGGGSAGEPSQPAAPPAGPAPAPSPTRPAPSRPAPAAAPRKAPAPRPAPPPRAPSLEEEEPVMVTAELVLRRSTRRARMTAAAIAVVAVAAVGGGGFFALQWKRSTAVGERRSRAPAGEASGATAGLSEADIAKLMGRKAPDPAPAQPRAAPRPVADDRPKHERLALKDRELLDLLNRKGDAKVTVQEDVVAALATTRGALEETAIEGTLSRNSASFAACVSRAIAASPDQRLPATKVDLELTIRPSGRVAKAGVQQAAIAKLPLGQCIAAAAKRMVFPGFDGEALDIVVPLKLKVGL